MENKNEIAVIESDRDTSGRFAIGNTHAVGRGKGSINRITARMKEQLADRLKETGEDGNPLIFLHDFMMDPQLQPALRLQAADKLLKYIAPRLLQVDVDTGERNVQMEVEIVREKLRAFISAPKDRE